MKLLKALSSISENTKTVFTLALALINIFCGTMRVNFILEDGNLLQMGKERRWEKVYNIALENINSKGSLLMEKEVDMEFLFLKTIAFIWVNGKMV